MDIETFLDAYGLIAIFGIMLAKSIGIPIPIPADALMLATSARVAAGRLALPAAFIALLVALSIGGVMQFSLVRGAGRNLINRFGRYLGLTPARVDAASARLQKGGALGIGVAILTPGVRSVAVIACGLASIPLRQFIPGLVLGSGLFLALHFILGYIGGSLLSALGGVISLPVLIVGLVVLLAAGLGAWYLIRRRQLPQATTREIVSEAVGAWHEATCPVCLALGAANRLQIQLPIEHQH
jgi:membrane protein DedA with SNARE-associated domain